jgi:FkbM family methyltransferase
MAGSWISVGFHEYEEILFTIDLLRAGDLVVDVGANLGVYTLVMSRRGARVVSFEPNPMVADVLRRNVLRNHPERISVRQSAVGEVAEVVSFGGPTDSQGRLFADGDHTTRVQVERLDDISGLGRPALIKVDAEGFDGHVLRGATGVIETAHPVIITEVFAGSPETRGWLEARGYRVYRYRPNDRTLEELPSTFDRQGSFIAVHRDALAGVNMLLQESVRPRIRQPSVAWL